MKSVIETTTTYTLTLTAKEAEWLMRATEHPLNGKALSREKEAEQSIREAIWRGVGGGQGG